MGDRIFLASPHMGGGEKKYIDLAFDTNWIAPLGANVNGFESDLQEYLGEGYVTALSAGTAALHLALRNAGVGRGDIVFCQSLTFSASANPILYEGAEAVFIDSEAETWNIDPAAVEKAIELYGVPKALVAVHLYGNPAKMSELEEICEKYGIALIEDAAEALGSEYKGKKCGTFGVSSALSFNGNKIITTSGGGALVSRSEDMAKHALKMATQSREPVAWYEHTELGFNYRMSNISAGIGRGQMEVLPQRVAKKREISERYREAFAGLPISLQPKLDCAESNCWLTAVTIDEGCSVTPAQLIAALGEENIEARHIWKPMHLQPVFRDCRYVSASEKGVGEDIFRRGLCLPSDTKMSDADLDRVIGTVLSIFK